MRLLGASATAGPLPMPSALSLSWPEPSSGLLALSGLLRASEPLTADPSRSLPFYKGCKAYEDGWSKRDEAPFSLLQARTRPGLVASKDQCGSGVGIEKLVDELCAKLKQIQDGEAEAPQSPRPNFALVLQDMHDSHYSGFPSLGAECRSEEFAELWGEECYDCGGGGVVGDGGGPWFSRNNQLTSLAEQLQQQQDTQEDEMLHVLAENHHNTLASLEENDLDLFLDRAEDHSLARLIAKFDSTVEALWSPDSMVLEDRSPQVEPQTFISSGTNLTSSIWSDTSNTESNNTLLAEVDKWAETEEAPLVTSEASWQIGYGLGILSQQILEGENEQQQNSLNLINHHREKSGFTEVRKTTKSWSGTDQPPAPPPAVQTQEEEREQEEEEEDLLTSTKTHFRPIKQQTSLELSSSHEAVKYEDGTTFAISSSLDKPPFTRSASGCYYLQAPDSPKKYMLYTEKEPFNGRYPSEGFVPKFAVRRTEKGVQTEREGERREEEEEESESEEDKGFYFPEDETQFADNIDCPADIEDEGEDSEEDQQEGEEEEESSEPAAWQHHQDPNVPTWRDAKWCGGAETLPCDEAGGESGVPWFRRLWLEGGTSNSGADGETSQQCEASSARLREELIAEGEQLFADIQYLQTLFLGDCWRAGELDGGECDEDEDTPPEDDGKAMSPVCKDGHSADWHAPQGQRTYDDLTAAPRTPHCRCAGPQCPLPASWETPAAAAGTPVPRSGL